MLENLTQEQEALLDSVHDEYLGAFYNPKDPDLEVIRSWLTVVYGLYDLPLPGRIEIAHSPKAVFDLAAELLGERSDHLDWCGVADAGWVSRYDAFHRLGALTDDEAADLLALREFMRVAWDSVLLDGCAIILAHPSVLKVDDDGDLHCADGPALIWRDGHAEWAWHGMWVDERLIATPRSYTRDEYLEMPTETRRALGEHAGWDWVVELLGGTLQDAWTDPETSLRYELVAAGDERWLRKQSPSLQNDSQPWYMEPVPVGIRTAKAARKWQATDWTPEDCERDPELRYGLET